MRAVAVAIVLIASAVVAARAQTPSRPNFSGTWTLVEGAATYPFGKTFTLSMTDEALDLQVEAVPMDTGTGQTYEMRNVRVHFDLTSKMTQGPAATDRPARASGAQGWVTSLEWSSSRAYWTGGTLSVIQRNAYRGNAAGGTPENLELFNSNRTSFRFDDSGDLLINRAVVNDPLPVETRADAVWPTQLGGTYRFRRVR